MADVHILTHEFRPKRGGAGVVCEKIAETLTRLGKDVTVWTPAYVEKDSTFEPRYDVRMLKRLKGTRNWPCLAVMAREVAHSRRVLKTADVYLGEPGPIAVFMLLTLVFPKKFWKRLIITLHGSEILRYQKSWWWGAPLFKRLAEKADAIHVLSRHNEQVLLDWIPSLQPKLVRGFGMSLPGESLPESRAIESEERKGVTLLCVGRIHPRKGQLRLLQAVATLAPELQRQLDVRFVGQFVKDGYYRELQRQAQVCKSNIMFTGGVSDEELETCYASADIFALTSMPFGNSVEGLGLVYLEASRQGLPILAHRIGGVGDVVIHGRNGYLADPDSLGSLVRNLDILIRNPVLRRQLGEEGRKMVKDTSWETIVRKLFY